MALRLVPTKFPAHVGLACRRCWQSMEISGGVFVIEDDPELNSVMRYTLCVKHAKALFPVLWEQMIGEMVAFKLLHDGLEKYGDSSIVIRNTD